MSLSATLQVRIVILNYQGKDLLPECLPGIVKAAQNAQNPTEVSVLHNPCDDESQSGLDYVRSTFPNVTIWISPENKILCSFNDYLPLLTEDVVILLNNDISVDPHFIDPLVERFKKNPKTFLVAPKVMDMGGKRIGAGPAKSGVRFGMFWCDARYKGYEADAEKEMPTVSSGFGAFSREKFLEFGGYRSWYFPGIMEDVDLCYRAKQKGYELFYEPKSIVNHIGQVSFKKAYSDNQRAMIAHRNNFIFMWNNLKGLKFWCEHLFWLPFRLTYSILKGDNAFIMGFLKALTRSKSL